VTKGYRDSSYRYSTDSALEAARAVLTLQQDLDRTNAPLVKDCYHLNHLQVAAVVIFIDICAFPSSFLLLSVDGS
jgi:hypothetical protein